MLGMAMTACAQKSNNLNRVYHHVFENKSENAGLELGNLIFYFENEQRVDLLSVNKGGSREERVFFFPLAHAKSLNVKAMLDQLAVASVNDYTLSLQVVEKPLQGIKCAITFNPHKIGLTYDSFESINLKKGVMFRFYDRSLIEKLKHKSKNVLRVTSNRAHRARVVIDCGHGGQDDGAIGCHQLKEKDVNLNIGIATAYLLKKKGIDVLMTRMNDETQSLSKRVEFANTKGADLLVSIHSNSAANDKAAGLETFSMVPSHVHKESTSLNGHELSSILSAHKQRFKNSSLLANSLQNSILETIKPINNGLKDRKAKKAVLLVLLGSVMPSALVEVGFISNPEEAALLKTQNYQRHVALGICRGILNYLDTVSS